MKRLSALLLMALVSVTLGAQAPAGDIPKLDVEKYTLANGLEVILSEDHRVPLVGVDVFYHVGPAHEAPGRTGFAHLFEHMMFQGSKHIESDAHFKLLAGAGATGVNGTTNFDRTNYFETMPSNQLELALWLESDRMGYLLETVDQAKLTNQQDVVRNERRQSTENRPYGIVEEALFQALFPKGHPYHGVVIGSHADIQAAKLDDVREFFRQYYAPNNATIAIAGDIDKAATRKLIEKYFGTLKRGPAVPPVKAQTPVITAERRLVVEDRVELPRVYMAWITPPFFKDGDADADIASSVLGQGRVSRLYKKLEYEKQIAQNVTAYQYSTMLGSVFSIEATARPGHTLQELETVINEEVELLRMKGPTAAEVERARNVLETQIFNGLQLVGGFGGVADQLNLYNHYTGNPDYLTEDIMRRRRVTPESVRQFAQRYLAPNARVIVHGIPGKQNLGPEVPKPAEQAATGAAPTVAINPDEPWRAKQPAAAVARAVRVPEPQSFTLPNGLTVIALPRTDGVPVVSASLVLRSGGDANPLDKPGLASFTADVLDQGTTTRNAVQLAEQVAQIGASLTTGTSRDATTVSTGSLSRNFPAALALVADVALRPSFPVEEVERVRATRLAELVEQRGNPVQVVGIVTGKALYGTHQYGFSESGTAESNKQLTRDDLQAFWRQHFVPGNAALVVTGAIAVPELRKLAETAFGSWPRGTVAPAEARRAGRGPAAPRHRRSPRITADTAARGHVRRSAQQSRLRAGARDEHYPRRHVRQPDQHEPARGARLHVRSEFVVRVLAQRRPVFRRDRRAHGCHGARGARGDARAQENERDARDAGGADTRERRDYAAAAGSLRNERSDNGQPGDVVHPRPALELLLESVRADFGCRCAGGAGGREKVSGA